MSETVIKVEGLGKKYIIGHQAEGGYKTFRDQIGDSLKTVFSKTKRMLSGQMVVEGNEMEDFWALKDVSFELRQGEVLGIIGRNGAGKSTLLKILSRITEPTTGKVTLKGRVASLLEVGTGFHPELSGRENIFLNGAILGMSRAEIKRKFDEMVDFSGVEKFLDTPVKRYSSGMYVRLAFSVAAHLEPEILIVDEVLAVGDAEFQKKCLGRIKDVSVNDGRTVLFVSHNMAAVRQLCYKGIVLENGKFAFSGLANEAINFYQSLGNEDSSFEHVGEIEDAPGNSNIKLLKIIVKPTNSESLSISSGFNIEVKFYNYKPNINLAISLILKNYDEIIISELGRIITSEKDSKEGVYVFSYDFPPHLLNAGNYYINLLFGEDQKYVLYEKSQVIKFEILNEAIGSNLIPLAGFLRLDLNGSHQFIGKSNA